MVLVRSLCVASLLVVIGSPALAEISITMKAWTHIPRVEISQGKSYSCDGNPIVWSGAMKSGDVIPASEFPGAGSDGDDICWRRSSDPLNPNSNLGIWTRCSSDGVCEII